MSLKKLLAEMGFESASRDVWACASGEIVHVFCLGKSRHGGQFAEVKVWHERFLIPGEELRLRDSASPLRGVVGPDGVISSWTWSNIEVAAEHIAKVVHGFVSCFSSLEDVRTALGPIDQSNPAWRLLYGPACAESAPNSPLRYPAFRGASLGALSKQTALQKFKETFSPRLEGLGFKVAQDDVSVVFHRQRGEIIDCARFDTDLYQTFGVLQVFPWSNDVWRAEKRIKGRYFSLTSKRSEALDSVWIREIHGVNSDIVQSAIDWIERQLELQAHIDTTAKFMLEIDPMYSTIRSQMAFLKVRN